MDWFAADVRDLWCRDFASRDVSAQSGSRYTQLLSCLTSAQKRGHISDSVTDFKLLVKLVFVRRPPLDVRLLLVVPIRG